MKYCIGTKKENIKYNDAEEIPITTMINPTWKNLSEDTDVQYEEVVWVFQQLEEK